ncbi:MAG: DegT/DnrJ/EryC1/StrS family aminotransferase [bacterium]
MIPLARPCFGPEEEAAVREVLKSGWVAQGPTTDAFEAEFAAAVGAPHAIAVSSCTTALHLAVIAAGARPGDEVILPSFTFPATANAVLYEGATPVLVDVDPATLNVDVAQVAAAIGKRTKAVIGVHLFGFPCEIEALRELCDERGVFLVEDAACAIGTKVGGRDAGTFGDVACFSLHARKVVTCGEGGVLTTSDGKLAELLKSLRSHGVDRSASARHAEGLAPASARHVRVGYNYRLSDVQSAIAREQLRKLPEFVRERNEIAREYDDAFADLEGLRLPPRRPAVVHSYQSYVVVLEEGTPVEPAAFRNGLAAAGISTRPGTYAVHREPYWAGRPATGLSRSAEAAERSVAVPMFNGLGRDERRQVVDAVRNLWKGSPEPARRG